MGENYNAFGFPPSSTIILTFSDNVRVVILANQNRVRSMFLEFLLIVEGGGNPDKRISEDPF